MTTKDQPVPDTAQSNASAGGVLTDSRRLTGPNLLCDGPGAILDVTLPAGREDRAVGKWRQAARAILDAVGWRDHLLYSRTFPGGASLVLTAPIDALYAATEVNEWAWDAANAELEGRPRPALDEAAQRLRQRIAAERNPRLIALAEAAESRGVACLSDQERVSVGLGRGSMTWPTDDLPDPEAVPWDRVHDVPIALVTGCNGKTTTVRLVGAIIEAAGLVPGTTSTDMIRVGHSCLEEGDWAGPSGARMLLRDTRVDVGVLEAARGGILRRGLGLRRAAVAAVTNVAEDHLGEFGIHDLRSLTETKLVVTRAIGPEGAVVLNGDDVELRSRGSRVPAPVTWFTLDPAQAWLDPHRRAGGSVVAFEDGELVLEVQGRRHPVAPVDAVPMTLGGLARYNIANALAAIGVAAGLGLPVAAMREGLRTFQPSSQDNPGRLNLFDLSGVKVILDFAHNPHGVAAVIEMAAAFPAARRLVLLGQAGDRDDAAIRALARAAWGAKPDRVVIKELTRHLRGRRPGEIPALLEDELLRAGARPEQLVRAGSEMDGVRAALAWARPGDLLLLPVQGDRGPTLALLERLRDTNWGAGDPLPE